MVFKPVFPFIFLSLPDQVHFPRPWAYPVNLCVKVLGASAIEMSISRDAMLFLTDYEIMNSLNLAIVDVVTSSHFI